MAASCLLITFVGFAQSRQITGTILSQNDNAPLQGVTVTNRNTNQKTQTDAKGTFSITAEKGHVLVLSYVGFGSQNLTVGDASDVSVSLTQSTTATLEDVVVVGYGTQKRGNLTGAVSTVNVEQTLGSRPITDVARGLQGAAPGLTITTVNGEIGTSPSIRLRGLTGSLNGAGAQPLILVDNVEIPDLRMVNPDDIETISVLKDAASTSIYGTRAAWGVVLITTKSGKKGAERSRVSYSNNFSWSTPTTTPEVASAAEGARMSFDAQKRANSSLSSFGVIGFRIDEIAIQKMQDWQNKYGGQDLGPEMVEGRDFELRDGNYFFYRPWNPGKMYMREWTPQQNHNLSLTGSNNKTGYTLSLGYMDQEGVLKVNPDNFQRLNGNLGVTSSISNWFDARAKVLYSRTLGTRPYYFTAEQYDPWFYLYRWPTVYPYGTFQGKPFRNSITDVEQVQMNENTSNFARLSAGGTFKIVKGLTVDVDYTYSNTNNHNHQKGGRAEGWDFWTPGRLVYGAYNTPTVTHERAIYTSSWNERNTFKAFATYNKVISDHSLKFIAGTDVEASESWLQSSERNGLISLDFPEIDLATGVQTVSGDHSHWSTRGYFGRINYAFKNKYLLELNGRMDGSSAFPTADQWGFFPSISAGYKISDESFMDFTKPVLSSWKLRGSWGSIGNQAVGGNKFISLLTSSNSNWVIGNTNMVTLSTPGLVSPTLTWETVTTLDLGTDARFFNNKLGVTFDWYRRTTSDMLSGGITVPTTLGTTASLRNFGELQTTGWELALDWNHTFKNGLVLTLNGNLSDFQEKITKYANTSKLLSANYEGKILGDIWGLETDRLYQESDFTKDATGNWILLPGSVSQSKLEASWFKYGPGDVKFVDLNGDGKIDEGSKAFDDHGDLKVIGNTTPRYQYGFRLGAEWKGFDFSAFVQGVGKREMWASGGIFIPGFRPNEAWYTHQMDYWTPSNTDAFYPRPTDGGQSNDLRNFKIQSKYLLNLAYTRLKNLTVGYSVPASLAKRVKLQSARFYVSGENLFEIDHLDIPIDPEVDYTSAQFDRDRAGFGRVYPYRRTMSVGVQISL